MMFIKLENCWYMVPEAREFSLFKSVCVCGLGVGADDQTWLALLINTPHGDHAAAVHRAKTFWPRPRPLFRTAALPCATAERRHLFHHLYPR